MKPRAYTYRGFTIIVKPHPFLGYRAEWIEETGYTTRRTWQRLDSDDAALAVAKYRIDQYHQQIDTDPHEVR